MVWVYRTNDRVYTHGLENMDGIGEPCSALAFKQALTLLRLDMLVAAMNVSSTNLCDIGELDSWYPTIEPPQRTSVLLGRNLTMRKRVSSESTNSQKYSPS